MSKKIGVLVIHGIGSQSRGFSDGLTEELRDRLGGDKSRFVWKEIFWADELKQREDQLWDCMQRAEDTRSKRLDLDWVSVRRFFVHNFGDALAYQRDARRNDTAYDLVHGIAHR